MDAKEEEDLTLPAQPAKESAEAIFEKELRQELGMPAEGEKGKVSEGAAPVAHLAPSNLSETWPAIRRNQG